MPSNGLKLMKKGFEMGTDSRITKEVEDKRPLKEIKADIAKDAWTVLEQYFEGGGDEAKAKVASFVMGLLAREAKTHLRARRIELSEMRTKLHN